MKMRHSSLARLQKELPAKEKVAEKILRSPAGPRRQVQWLEMTPPMLGTGLLLQIRESPNSQPFLQTMDGTSLPLIPKPTRSFSFKKILLCSCVFRSQDILACNGQGRLHPQEPLACGHGFLRQDHLSQLKPEKLISALYWISRWHLENLGLCQRLAAELHRCRLSHHVSVRSSRHRGLHIRCMQKAFQETR
jgi:hypothetical protein